MENKGSQTQDNTDNSTEDYDEFQSKEKLAFDWNVSSHTSEEIVF